MSTVHRVTNGHDTLHPAVWVAVALRIDATEDEIVTEYGEHINATGGAGPRFDSGDGVPVDGSDGTFGQPATRAIVSTLVLSTAAVLFGLVTFVVGQLVAAGLDGPHLVDTADCWVNAMAAAKPFDSANCNKATDSSIGVAGESVHSEVRTPPLRPSQIVPAAGLWIHSILQSLG